jgi:hypothetical protein
MADDKDPRGHAPGAPVSAFPGDSLESSSLDALAVQGVRTAVVAAFPSSVEAAMARSRLEAEGLFADLLDEHTVSIGPHLALAVGGVKVRVLEDDLARAREILDTLGDFALPDDDNDGNGGDDDDKLERAPKDSPDRLASRALAAGIIGAVFFPPLNLWSLWLLLRAVREEDELSAKAKRSMALALAFDSLALLWLYVLLPG